jgi:hypothetical protein
MQAIIHCPEILHSVESTLDEQSSFGLVENFYHVFPLFYHYSSNEYGLKETLNVATTFSALHARVKVQVNGFDQTINSSIPLDILRYKMLEDGSYHSVSRSKSFYKPGYIVEGALWSNGFYHLTREEDSTQILDLHFYIDQYTKTMHRYI